MLNGVSWNDEYQGLQERRILIADLSLTAKSYIFPPIKDFKNQHNLCGNTSDCKRH